MTRRNTTKRVSVQLRESLYQRLREHASEQGEQTETLLDSLIMRWLDEEERRN